MIAQGNGYSTDLEGFLCVGSERFPLAELGPDFCIVRRSVSLPPSKGEIVLLIDGSESRIAVSLPDGAAVDRPRITYANLQPLA
jgi:hypothetical protein